MKYVLILTLLLGQLVLGQEATGDYTLTRKTASGYTKKIITPQTGRALGFDSSGDPINFLAEYNGIGFYDRFDDYSRYPDGASLTTGVTLPRVGSPWALSYTAGGVAGGARVVNGKIQLNRDSGYYLGANATLNDNTNWSMGVEFYREPTYLTASSTNNFTLAFGPPNIVLADGSGIQISGNPHINMNESGVNSVNMNFGQTAATGQGSASTDQITTVAAHNLETYDMVALAGTLPAGTSTSINYYAYKVSNTVIKLALNRANILSNTFVDLTTDGGTVTLARAAECLNRVYANGVHSWSAPTVTNYLFQGSSSADTLTFPYNHNISTNDVIMAEGAGLPAGMSERVAYYAIYDGAKTIKVSATLGGSAIDLTTNGSASQLLRTARRELPDSIPYGKKSIVTFRVRGDFFQVSLEGVGTIEYYYRGMAAKIPKAMSFYWQSPGASFLGSNYHSTYSASAIWVDAPKVEQYHTRRLPAYLSTSGNSTQFANQLQVVDSRKVNPYSLMWPNISSKIAIVAGASSVTPIAGSVSGNVGGNIFADGNLKFNPGFSEFNSPSQAAFASGTSDCSIDTAIPSLSGSSTTAVKSILSISGLTTGSMEEYELCGYMTGTNAKRILLDLDNNPTFSVIFDSNLSGTPLNAITVPWKIKILRKQEAANSHVTYATMEYNGTIIGPQRCVANAAADYRNIRVNLITADASGLVLETILKRTNPVKDR
jgi:hypothetical protein